MKADTATRAIAAYYRQNLIGQVQQHSEVREHEVSGRRFVTLHNRYGLLKAYRVKPDGSLQGLETLPVELADELSA
jgi:hypothetical protein